MTEKASKTTKHYKPCGLPPMVN